MPPVEAAAKASLRRGAGAGGQPAVSSSQSENEERGSGASRRASQEAVSSQEPETGPADGIQEVGTPRASSSGEECRPRGRGGPASVTRKTPANRGSVAG